MKFSRTRELTFLQEFINTKGSGFIFVRGRRRIGKTWVLNRIKESNDKKNSVFFYTGNPQDKPYNARSNFAKKWVEFCKCDVELLTLASKFLTWEKIFLSINNFAKTKNQKLIIILDEIQWIGGVNGGIVAPLKEAWNYWYEAENIKIIISGSSNKFFSNMSGGQDKILYGIETSAPLVIQQLSIKQLKQEYFLNWTYKEVCLVYMFFGGIPYYILQLDNTLPFIEAINKAAFTNKSIFINEGINAINLEFNEQGQKKVLDIMNSLSNKAFTLTELSNKSNISIDLLHHTIKKLISYELIEQKQDFLPKKNNRSDKYCINDFFLNFYFTIIIKYLKEIKGNIHSLIFSRIFFNPQSDYINGFSGFAFERLIKHIIEKSPETSAIHKKLMILPQSVTVTSLNKEFQIDLIIENNDKLIRTIECKWADTQNIQHIYQAKYKNFTSDNNIKNYLAVSYLPNDKFIQLAAQENVTLIVLEDLF